jgi:hypothetical protein
MWRSVLWSRRWRDERTRPLVPIVVYIDEAGEPWLERDVVLADPVEAAWVDAAPKKSA